MNRQMRFLVHPSTRRVTSAAEGGSSIRIRPRRLPDNFFKSIEHCVTHGKVPGWARDVGIDQVTQTGNHYLVVWTVFMLDEFAPRLATIDNEQRRSKLEELHYSMMDWLTNATSTAALTPAERSMLYREKMLSGGVTQVQVKVRVSHSDLIRRVARELLNDKSGRVEEKLNKLVGLPKPGS